MSERGGSEGIPWGSIAVLVAFVSSTLLVHQAFQPLRPAEKDRAQASAGADLEVEARLWEDPFAATRRYEAQRRAVCANDAKVAKSVPSGASASAVPQAAAADPSASAPAGTPGHGHEIDCDDARLVWRRGPERLLEALDRDGDGVRKDTLILVVTLPGNAFVGAEEARRRARYAVLAGLQAQGLLLDDAEHFGLLQFVIEGRRFAEARSVRVPYDMLSRRSSLRGDGDGERETQPYRQAAVLWVDETALPQPRLDALAALLGTLGPQQDPPGGDKSTAMSAANGQAKLTPPPTPDEIRDAKHLPALALISPSSSDLLRAYLLDLDRAANLCPPPAARAGAGEVVVARVACEAALSPDVVWGYRRLAAARVFNAIATASKDALPELRDQKLETYLRERLVRIGGGSPEQKLDYSRTMATDDQVLRALVLELQLRLPRDVDRRLVLLAERDSLYAQALVSELRFRLGNKKSPMYNPRLRLEVHYFYRGMDGATNVDSAAESSAAAKDKTPAAVPEWPESRDQLDYLRRLAIALKQSEGDGSGGLPLAAGDTVTESGTIGAIGLLASDVHDKLMVLQALHDSFPDKVFFTTDLDARFVHSRTLAYTRNLVVASSLPLAFPDPRVQAGAPPFRDVYQTALFVAAQQAGCRQGKPCETLREELQRALDQPSIYEIGRQRAVPLAGYDYPKRVRNQHLVRTAIALPLWLLLAGALLVWPSTPAIVAARRWLFGGMRPAAAAAEPLRLPTALLAVLHLTVLAYALGSAVEFAAPGRLDLAGILLLTAATGGAALLVLLWRGARRHARRSAPWAAAAVCAVLLASGSVWTAWPTAGDAPCNACEPAAWLEGVSAWPSHLIHLLALVALVCILDLQWSWLQHRFDKDTQWLGLKNAGDADLPPGLGWYRAYSLIGWSPAATTTAGVDFAALWQQTALRASPQARVLRTLFSYAVTVGVMAALFLALSDGQIPEVPVRGHEHRALVRLTLYLLLASLPMLMVAVADATLLTTRFIGHLDRGRSFYPNAVLQRFARALGDVDRAEIWTRPLVAAPAQRAENAAAGRHTLLDDWIDVRLIARRTAATAPLIVGPLLIVALLVVARSRLFDNWAITLPVALGICAYLVWLVVLTVLLKRAAERARTKALLRMRADALWLEGAGDDWKPLREPFGRLIDEVREMREGAFAPLLDQPLLKALLVPLGGLGGTQLFDYFLLAH